MTTDFRCRPRSASAGRSALSPAPIRRCARLDPMPEFLVADSGPCIDAAIRCVEYGTQFPSMRQQQTLQFLIVFDPDPHANRLAIPGYANGASTARLRA